MSTEIHVYCKSYEDPYTDKIGLDPSKIMRDAKRPVTLHVGPAQLQGARKGKSKFCVLARTAETQLHNVVCEGLDDAAEQFAEHYHNRRDGWESSWPIEFVVHDGTNYHLVEVERRTVPEFHAGMPKRMFLEEVLP